MKATSSRSHDFLTFLASFLKKKKKRKKKGEMNSAPPVHICFCICFRTHYLFRLNNAHIIVYIPNTSAPDISKYQPFLLFLSCLKPFRSLFGNAKRFIFFSQTNVSRSMLRHFIPLVLLLLFSTFF